MCIQSDKGACLTTVILLVLHSSLFPEVYKIETGDSEQFGGSSSQKQHFFVLGDNHGNHSGTTADLIQKLYMLSSSEEVMVNDREEPPWEETAAPVNDKQGSLRVLLLKTLKYFRLAGLFHWGLKSMKARRNDHRGIKKVLLIQKYREPPMMVREKKSQ